MWKGKEEKEKVKDQNPVQGRDPLLPLSGWLLTPAGVYLPKRAPTNLNRC